MPTLWIRYALKTAGFFRRTLSLVARPRRIAAHRPGSGAGERRLCLLGHLDKRARGGAVVGPGVDRVEEVDAARQRRAVDAADACAAVVFRCRDLEAHQLVARTF